MLVIAPGIASIARTPDTYLQKCALLCTTRTMKHVKFCISARAPDNRASQYKSYCSAFGTCSMQQPWAAYYKWAACCFLGISLSLAPRNLSLNVACRCAQLHTVLAFLCCNSLQPGHRRIPASFHTGPSCPGRSSPASTMVLCTCCSSGKLSVSHRCSNCCCSVRPQRSICGRGVHLSLIHISEPTRPY